MGLHPNFPESPYAILGPALRWFPADEALRESSSEKLMPPLVPQLRRKVKEWRDSGYVGATNTSKSLLNWWFNTPHLLPQTDGTMAEFQYYFAQREALEIIICLYDVVGVTDKFDMMRFDSPGAPPPPITPEQLQSFTAPMLSRNPALHFVFARMGMAEEQGLGIGSLRDRAKELGLPLPRYTWDAPYLVLKLYRSAKSVIRELPANVLDSLNAEERRGWEYLATKTACTRAAYEQHMGVDTRKAQRHFKRFVGLGLLRKIGASTSTSYEVQRL